ncbi:MAG: hypothetical protein IKN63_01915 [Bacilli bacterium]|nr:hypothetical protein [Bacilli bacterium]
MRTPIFNLNNKTSYKDEYNKIIKVLNTKCVSYNKKEYTYFDYVNTYLFNNWKYRNTFLDCYSYLEFIGVNLKSKKITKSAFINMLEFILNMEYLMESIKSYYEKTKLSTLCQSIIFHNIPLILESFNLEPFYLDDKIIISSKNINYEDLRELVPNDIYELLLSYTSINNNGINMKRIILNKIYDYLSLDYDKYKSYNPSIFNTVKFIINKMGVIDKIDKKYKNFSNITLKKYYDDAFLMITYLIQTDNITSKKDEIKNIKNQ